MYVLCLFRKQKQTSFGESSSEIKGFSLSWQCPVDAIFFLCQSQATHFVFTIPVIHCFSNPVQDFQSNGESRVVLGNSPMTFAVSAWPLPANRSNVKYVCAIKTPVSQFTQSNEAM